MFAPNFGAGDELLPETAGSRRVLIAKAWLAVEAITVGTNYAL